MTFYQACYLLTGTVFQEVLNFVPLQVRDADNYPIVSNSIFPSRIQRPYSNRRRLERHHDHVGKENVYNTLYLHESVAIIDHRKEENTIAEDSNIENNEY